MSLDGGVEKFAQVVRSHWGIENQLHWCLDVDFNEDNCPVRNGHSPENMLLIRHIALNLLSKESSSKVEKKAKRLKTERDNNNLIKILTG